MVLANLFQCLGHSERLRILAALFDGPQCVQELQTTLGLSQVEVSKHLAVLKVYGIVESRKDRNWRIYAIAQNASVTIQRQLKCLRECLSDEEPDARAKGPAKAQETRRKTVPLIAKPVQVSQPVRPDANATVVSGIAPLEDHLL